jgi:signal transduction histidine kinase
VVGLPRLSAWYRDAPLRTKFGLLVVLSITLLFAVLLPIVLYIQARALLSAVEEHGFRVAQILARSSVQAVVADDYLVMQHVINGVSSERRVRYAMLLKDSGEVLAHTRALERGRRYTDPISAAAAATRAPLLQRHHPAESPLVYDFAVPVYVLGEKRATARIGLSVGAEQAEIARTRNYILLLGLAVLGLGIAWATLEARRLTRPVQALVDGTRAIARGHLDHRIPVTTGDELGQLATAFNRMTDSVHALIETSRALSSSLDPDAVLRSVVTYALALVKADLAAIAPLAPDADEARVKVAVGARASRLPAVTITPGRGMGGAVLATGEPVISTNYLRDPGIVHDPSYDAMCREEGVVSAVAVPITLRGQIVGLLWVAHRTPRLFTGEDVDVLQRMARQAAIAMENARLYDETRVKTARLESLLRMSQAITATLDPARIADVVRDVVTDLMHGVVARVWMIVPGEDRLLPLGARCPEFAGGVAVGRGLVGSVAASRAPLVVPDVPTDPRVVHRTLIAQEGIVSFLGLPLLREDRLLGVLEISTHVPYRFTDDEISVFSSFAQQAAIALENAGLYQALKASHEELLTAQEELVRKTRMAAMGQIAAVVAHEARNPLGAVSNCVQLLRGNPHLTGEDAELLAIVQSETQRLNEIVSDFLAFGRPRPPQFQDVDVHEIITSTLAGLRRDDRCPDTVLLAHKFDPDVPVIRGDPDQLRQVFWNLLLNAVEVMRKGGELRVETRHAAPAVEITVHDTGPGIPPSVLPRIFEPFFTTRAAGTGLGLAIVRRIVEEHGGHITVNSEQGVGTCFTLSLAVQPRIS